MSEDLGPGADVRLDARGRRADLRGLRLGLRLGQGLLLFVSSVTFLN